MYFLTLFKLDATALAMAFDFSELAIGVDTGVDSDQDNDDAGSDRDGNGERRDKKGSGRRGAFTRSRTASSKRRGKSARGKGKKVCGVVKYTIFDHDKHVARLEKESYERKLITLRNNTPYLSADALRNMSSSAVERKKGAK